MMHIPILDVNKVPPVPRNERRKGIWKAAPAAWIFGWVFSTLGTAFVLVMLIMQLGSRPSSLFPDFFIERNPGLAMGVVDEVIWVTSNRGSQTHRLEFTFSAGSQTHIAGFCYTTNGAAFEAGQEVEIEYESGNPTVSRVTGTRAGRVHYLLFVFADVFF